MRRERTCTIRITDEVNCIFVGLIDDHLKYFHEEYAFFAPNYFFNPKYKLKRWDGKIRYFTLTGKTYVALLEEIIPRVVGLGYKVKVADLRKDKPPLPLIDENLFSHILDPLSGKPWTFRDYQVEMVNALLSAGGGVGIAGTGAGKTSMVAAVSYTLEKAENLRTIVIVPDKNLIVQTKKEYKNFGLDVGEYSSLRKDVNHQHVISTWQSLNHSPVVLEQFHAVIVDECHGIKGNVLTELLVKHGKNILYRFGVTGTLPKEKTDALAVRIAVGEVQYDIKAHQLIEQGHLAKLHIDIMQMDVDLTHQYEQFLRDEQPLIKPTYNQFRDNYFPDWQSEKRYLQNETHRLEWIADFISSKGNEHKGNVLCLVSGVAFGKKLSKMIPESKFIYGKDDMETRTQVYETFKDSNNVIAIATVNIASTGLNINRIFNLMFIDVGKSFIRVIQSIGRGLRKASDKQSVVVTDICSNLKYSRRHLRERTAYYNEAKYPHKKYKVLY